ncbi:MAG: hypothetical protein K2N91_05120 [Muribaculaceae bacterium]|nr:hypothetical protein [Muribaculaceae bacterium]
MNDNKRFSVDELVNHIQEYADTDKKQERPVIVWFEDNVEGDILKYSDTSASAVGLASALSKSNCKIAYYDNVGSPLTDHDYMAEGDQVKKLSEADRRQFIIPQGVIEPGTTKVYIHAPHICYIGEKGLTSLEYGAMVHDRLHLPVFIMFKSSWKKRINADLSAYDEYVCTDSNTDVLAKWFERAEEKDSDGYQIVDNFYLDFLKQAPLKYVSYQFDPAGPDGVTFCSYDRWESASSKLPNGVLCMIAPPYALNLTDDQLAQFASVFKNGNIDFEALEAVLNTIPEEKWREWLEDHDSFMKRYIQIPDDHKRIEVAKAFFCCDFNTLANIPSEVSVALLKFHGLLAD